MMPAFVPWLSFIGDAPFNIVFQFIFFSLYFLLRMKNDSINQS